jgi:hypothetical protein
VPRTINKDAGKDANDSATPGMADYQAKILKIIESVEREGLNNGVEKYINEVEAGHLKTADGLDEKGQHGYAALLRIMAGFPKEKAYGKAAGLYHDEGLVDYEAGMLIAAGALTAEEAERYADAESEKLRAASLQRRCLEGGQAARDLNGINAAQSGQVE